MAHRVHPKIFRIREMKDWDARGFYEKNFSKYLEEDFRIRDYLEKQLRLMRVGRIEIERFPAKINIIISTSRPGLIIGRGGEGLEKLKKELKKRFLKEKELNIEVRPIKDPWASAALAAQWIAQQIEKRTSYKRTLKQALSKIMASQAVQGAKVQVSGRLNGVEMARTEWLKEGKLPRQTIRSDIEYGEAKAFCTYGVIGVKVWIYKGEKNE